LANKKGTTMHGYATNVRAHYLPAFSDMQLSEISIEAVQTFLNQKASEGKAVRTLKNLKWGLSAIFVAAQKYGYMTSNPARGADLPPEEIREQKPLPIFDQLSLLIERLKEPVSTAVWLVAVSCVRSEELAFKWKGLNAEKRELWVVPAVNQGKLHTPKYHRVNRPTRLTESDVQRLLDLKAWKKAMDDDWVFRIVIRLVRSGTRLFWPGAFSRWQKSLVFRISHGAFSDTGERHRWWRHVCPSRQRRSAWGTRDPTSFSSSTLTSSTVRRTRRQSLSVDSSAADFLPWGLLKQLLYKRIFAYWQLEVFHFC
jgi:hypothetical protein